MSRASTTFGRGRVWGGGFNRDVLESWVASAAVRRTMSKELFVNLVQRAEKRFLSPHLVVLLRLWLALTTLSGIWAAILLVPVPPLVRSFAGVGCIETATCCSEVRYVRWPILWRRTSSMS